MTVATSPPILTENQRFVLPGRHSWEDFKVTGQWEVLGGLAG